MHVSIKGKKMLYCTCAPWCDWWWSVLACDVPRCVHQSPGYFDHVSELIVIIFKTYFENDQNILTSSSSMGFLPIKLMIIIISTFSIFLSFSQHLFDNLQIILCNSFTTLFFYYNLYQNKWCHFYYKVYGDCLFIVKCIRTYFNCFEYKLYNDCLQRYHNIYMLSLKLIA
jgi:hypothetical protein